MIQNRTNITKQRPNNRTCFDQLLDPKMEQKRVPKPPEMEAKMVQNRSQKRAQRKNEESMKTNNSPTFWLDFGCLRGWKIEEEIEKRVSKTIQNRRVILKRIFKGFWSFWFHFGTQDGPKIGKKGINNKTDFKTNARERMPGSGPKFPSKTGVVWSGIGPGAPRNSRAR